MFQPETYVERLDREVSFDKPTLFISHLTAAHWPYYTADTPFGVSKPVSEEDRPMYRIGLTDCRSHVRRTRCHARGQGRPAECVGHRAFGSRRGIGSARRLVLRRHLQGRGTEGSAEDGGHGHGQSVLSKSQYQVLLGFRTFGRTEDFGTGGREFKYPVTVEDISPTILGFLGIGGDPLSATGQSLLPMLESGRDGTRRRTRAHSLHGNRSASAAQAGWRRRRSGHGATELGILRGRPRDRAAAHPARVRSACARVQGDERPSHRTSCLRPCLRDPTHTNTSFWISLRTTAGC